MGCVKFFSSSSYDAPVSSRTTNITNVINQVAGDPNPRNFNILKVAQEGNYCLLVVRYPDCHNYEGMKIMLYRAKYDAIVKQGSLDPHFSENKLFLSPIARFEPTEVGYNMGVHLMETLAGKPCGWKLPGD